ncbi:MAG: hypothetical protein WD793_00035, partial [Steroidobacteraceae bacterium]
GPHCWLGKRRADCAPPLIAGVERHISRGGVIVNALWRAAAVVVLAIPPCVYGQSQDDPYSKLAFFEGTWTVQGQETTYRETCTWSESRRFLICKAEDKESGSSNWSMSIFGYSAEKQAYTHTLFGSSGNIRSIHGWHDGTLWTFTGETQVGGNTKRMQVTIRPTKKGFVFRQDVSTNGSAWKQAAEFSYVRLP